MSILYYFKKYLSDKSVNGYHKVYDELFQSKKYDKIKLLEIGVGTLNNTCSNMNFWKEKNELYMPGSSLKSFRDYFPNGIIYGIDNQLDCLLFDDRIYTYIFDSRNKKFCDKYFSDLMFDFIIDDGDHFHESQITTLENLWSKLKIGGNYIIEDLVCPEIIKSYLSDNNYDYTFHETITTHYNSLIVINK